MDTRHVVVVGASLAGLRAVHTARKRGFDGRLTLVGAEPHLPYDRPPLSKDFLDAGAAAVEPWLEGGQELAATHGVELALGEPATGLDPLARLLHVGDREINYDALLVATGVQARTLPGADHLDGVLTLRSLDDAARVRQALDAGARTVVIGAGFIGSEVASAARKRGLDVTLVETQPTPLVRSVGEYAGRALSDLHLAHGTDLRCGVGVDRVVGDHHVEGVELADGSSIEADLVVVGIGASPATSWLAGSGLALDNGLVCDSHLRAGPNVWAAGDVARWDEPGLGVSIRLEHWTNAAEMASVAMTNLLDPENASPYRHVPYFWSDWYGSRIQFAGLPEGDPEIVTGGWGEPAFVALYRRNQRLIGALALNKRGDIMKYRALIARGATWQDGLDLAAARNARALVAN